LFTLERRRGALAGVADRRRADGACLLLPRVRGTGIWPAL